MILPSEQSRNDGGDGERVIVVEEMRENIKIEDKNIFILQLK